MSKKTKKADTPEVEQQQPPYVQELLKKGAVVLLGRSQCELEEMMAAIPSDVNFYSSQVNYYIDKGFYRVQVNLK